MNKTVEKTCKKYGVRLYDYANVSDHLHLLLKLRHIRDWAAFIRELTSRIAAIFSLVGGFFAYRPFTQIVEGWGRAYRTARDYLYLNQLQADGIINRAQIKTLKDLKETIFPDG